MAWELWFAPGAERDYERLDHSLRKQVAAAISKVANNPLPNSEGGYGQPLGIRNSGNLTGALRIKLRTSGLRVVYLLDRRERTMLIVAIGQRDSGKVYGVAKRRMTGSVFYMRFPRS